MTAIAFWRQKERYYRILGSKCKNCGSEFFPPIYKCRRCGSYDIEDREMPKSGTILTYTRLYEPMSGLEEQSPVIFGLIRLDNGVKIVGQIVDASPEEVHTGARVKAVLRRVRVDGDSGQIFYGYKLVLDKR